MKQLTKIKSGMKNKGRPINGVFLLNKPLGISSNLALQKVKRLFQAQKAGHTGSLDPLATGMLPICFGEATKFSQFLLDANKRYTTVAKLGVKTETSDSEGAIVAENPVPHLSLKQLAAILEKFRGPIKQIPSMYSALKHNGKALYKYARDGQVIERSARDIIIHDLRLIHYQDNLLELDVHCSKGTYIRNLVEDIGEAIGCGAHVVKLHRTSVSHLPTKMYTLEQLTALMDKTQAHTMHNDEAFKELLPIEVLVKDLPSLFIARRDAVKLLQGKLVALSDEQTDLLMDLKQQQISSMTSIAIYLIDNKEFIGIGSLNANNILRAKRMMSLRLKE